MARFDGVARRETAVSEPEGMGTEGLMGPRLAQRGRGEGHDDKMLKPQMLLSSAPIRRRNETATPRHI